MTTVNPETLFSPVRWPVALLLAIGAMLLLPVITHSILAHPPEYDELLHVLAARGINEAGVPGIADGLYTRAELYTRLIAWVTGFSDNELVAARLPALFFGMLLTALLTGWVAVRAGWIAALVVAGLFVISPMTLNSAVLVRFYTLHTLLMTMLLLFWFESSHWQRYANNLVRYIAICAAVSVVLIWLGMQFHDLTKITIVSGVAALFMVVLFDYRRPLKQLVDRHPVLIGLAGLCLAVVFVLIFIRFDVMTMLRGTVPMWSVDRAGNYAFYISALSVHLPFIWPLFPLMVICAFFDKPRVVVFCLTAFLVSLLINSLAAQKATRYFYHAYPMFCILWAIGFQRAVVFTIMQLRQQRQMAIAPALLSVLVVLALSFISAHEIKRGIKLVLNRGELDETIPVKYEPDWTKALPAIGDLAKNVDTLIVTSGVKGLYAFGRYDYEMSTTVVQDTDTGLDFGNDPRTNRRVFGQPESVETVIDGEGQELFVLEDRMINQAYSSPVESVSVLNKRCEAMDLSATGSQLSAWLCEEK